MNIPIIRSNVFPSLCHGTFSPEENVTAVAWIHTKGSKKYSSDYMPNNHAHLFFGIIEMMIQEKKFFLLRQCPMNAGEYGTSHGKLRNGFKAASDQASEFVVFELEGCGLESSSRL